MIWGPGKCTIWLIFHDSREVHHIVNLNDNGPNILSPFRTTTYFPKRNISEKLLSYPACYCINLRCLFQTLYRNAFSSLRDHLWYSLLRSSSDPYWNWVLSAPLHEMLWMPQGQFLFAHKRELLIETWGIKSQCMLGQGRVTNDGKGEPLLLLCFRQCFTRSFKNHLRFLLQISCS